MSHMSSEELMVKYLTAIDKERQEEFDRVFGTLTEREQQLVREAAVMGHVLGAQAAGGIKKIDYPKDSLVVRDVVLSCRSHSDIYPVIGTLNTLDEIA